MAIKDTNKKRLIIQIILIIVIFLFIAGLVATYISNLYKQQLYEITSTVMQNISKEYGKIESNTIRDIFKNNNANNEYGKDLLKKYGYEVKNMDFITNRSNLNTKITIIIYSIIIVSLITILLIVILYVIKQNKKIKKLAKYSKEILEGKYNLDIRDNEETELSLLKNQIYDMTTMLREKNENISLEKKQIEKLLADISHQIKTPLTSLNIINELLHDDDMDMIKKKEFLDKMQKELYKIEWLIKNLLNLARLDSKVIVLKKEKIKAEYFLQKIVNNFDLMAEIKNVKININAEDNCYIFCDENWTIEAINNLVKNAIEHGSKNIDISICKNNIFSEILVKDDGNGIDQRDINKIFDRFYKAKNSSSDSIGIGLAFVKSIIKNQSGDIRVISKVNEGTKFTVKLYN